MPRPLPRRVALLATALTALGCSGLFGGHSFETMPPFVGDGRDVAARNGTVIAATSAGILRSEDLGELYRTDQASGTAVAWAGETVFVGTDDGRVLRSDDDGTTWASAPLHGTDWVVRGLWGTEETVLAVGPAGMVQKSRDRGRSWDLVSPLLTAGKNRGWEGDPNRGYYGIDGLADGSLILVVGSDGAIYRSTDGGERWHAMDSGVGGTLRGVHIGAQGVLAVGGQSAGRTGAEDSPLAVRSDDLGVSWEPVEIGGAAPLVDVAASAEGTWLALDEEGAVWLSDDGLDWWDRRVGAPPMAAIATQTHADLDHTVAVGANGSWGVSVTAPGEVAPLPVLPAPTGPVGSAARRAGPCKALVDADGLDGPETTVTYSYGRSGMPVSSTSSSSPRGGQTYVSSEGRVDRIVTDADGDGLPEAVQTLSYTEAPARCVKPMYPPTGPGCPTEVVATRGGQGRGGVTTTWTYEGPLLTMRETDFQGDGRIDLRERMHARDGRIVRIDTFSTDPGSTRRGARLRAAGRTEIRHDDAGNPVMMTGAGWIELDYSCW